VEVGGVSKGGERQERHPEGENMPGVIMENGSRNGSHTNHDRDQRPNGINGASHSLEKTQDKGKGRVEPQQNVTPTSPTIPNGLGIDGSVAEAVRHQDSSHAVSQDLQDRVGQLPPEILHITQGYMPLSNLISRLAQKTHNDLTDTIVQMAQMATPTSVVNGNASYTSPVDDTSIENINKKLRMLNFAQDAHTEWVKALVITEWSRKSEDVSKMIDLRVHIDTQKEFYDSAIHEMSVLKRGLLEARVPNPDLKTALQVLSTGKAPWMPEVCLILISIKYADKSSLATLNPLH
jgi:mediator of RNA polymerase II transcription subunit 14